MERALLHILAHEIVNSAEKKNKTRKTAKRIEQSAKRPASNPK